MRIKKLVVYFVLVSYLLVGCQSVTYNEGIQGLYINKYRMSEEEERGFMLAGGKNTSLLYQLMTPKEQSKVNIRIWKLKDAKWEMIEEISHQYSTLRPLVVLRNDLKDVVHGVFFTNSDNYQLEDSIYVKYQMPEAGPYDYRVPVFLEEGINMEYNKEYSLVANFYTNSDDQEIRNVSIDDLYNHPEKVPEDKVEESYLWTLSIEE